MATRSTIRDHFRETRLFTHRAMVASVLTVILSLALVVRLAVLQIIDSDHYATLSDQNRVHIDSLPPTRGLIFDRNGVLLAQNQPAYRLELVPERVPDMGQTLAEIGKLITLSDSDIDRFNTMLKRTRPFQTIPLRTRLNDEEVARIAVNRHRFPGVDITARLVRHYPHGGLGVHALGYVGRINEAEVRGIDPSNYDGTDFIGKSGVEKYYEDLLHGLVGVQQAETNAQGRTVRVLDKTPPQPGRNLHLALDINLQRIAENALGTNRGAVVAIDPRDGGVVALVSMPTFDPNLFVSGIDEESYQLLQASEDQPLFDRAVRGQYPPGSTIKPFMGLAGLEAGLPAANANIYCPGWYTLPGDTHHYRDWKKGGHGPVDLDRAIVESCDVFFYSLGLSLGIDRISDFMMAFGFNAKTDLDTTGELSGLVPTREWKRRNRNEAWYPGETLITSIGQGFNLATPLQLASAVGALSRYGVRMKPHLLHAVEDPASRSLAEIPAQPLTPAPVVNRDNWERIIQSMKRVIHSERGTARGIGVKAGYTIAGKTGTAQVFGMKQDEEYVAADVAARLRDHALFIAFAPVEDPQIAIAILVENGGSGGAVAAPIARKVMDYYLLGEAP